MAQTFCLFLRGINVNGIKIKMNDLREIFLKQGFLDLHTVLASGNVVLTTPEDTMTTSDLQHRVEVILSDHYKYDAHVIVMTPRQIAAICQEAETHNVPKNYHHYLLICGDEGIAMEINEIYKELNHLPLEQVLITESGVFWIVEKGLTLQSEFGSKILGSKNYKTRLTSRTMNTILKVNHHLVNE